MSRDTGATGKDVDKSSGANPSVLEDLLNLDKELFFIAKLAHEKRDRINLQSFISDSKIAS